MKSHVKMLMNGKRIACTILSALLAWNLAAIAADAVTQYKAQPRGSKITIEGDSTVHKWTMEGTIVGGFVELPPIDGLKEGKVPAKVEANIPVRSMKSGHTIMDNLYQEALLEPKFPKIEYRLTEMTLKPGHVAGAAYEFDTKGQLSFAGVTNVVSMPVKMTSEASKIKITGNCPLKMTAFGIKPPAPNIGLGMMRCDDNVNIVFEWALALPAAPAAEKK